MGPRKPATAKSARDAFTAVADDRVHLTVRIPASLRQELKIYAAKHDISVTNAVTSAVEELLQSRKSRKHYQYPSR